MYSAQITDKTRDNYVLDSYFCKVGHINIEYDNYDTLLKTTGPSLNESIGIVMTKLMVFTQQNVFLYLLMNQLML